MAYYDPTPEPERLCDHPDCAQDGLFRAPKSRDHLTDYHWFCLDHVRAYNKAWNYCQGMSEDEIEGEIRRSTVWDRPTWPAGIPPRMEERLRQTLYNSGGFYGYDKPEAAAPQRHTPETKALATLGLAASATFKAIKDKYRELVKQHHPDRNGGDIHAEERFKTISQAFHTLKRAHELDKVH
jgi:DnaJ-domain-containing protein 1